MTDEPARRRDEGTLRALVPQVLARLVRRGEDFDAAEDALQDALLEALRVWPEHPPRDPSAWLATVATRRLVDARRSQAARHRREERAHAEPRPALPRRATTRSSCSSAAPTPTSRPPLRWR
ncbi:sigma factor [Pengzhenrongella frigida]|uniref:sigma factor n=1 Tax=Pengzhenrongella frigida TaxID=1259133 RepID=UPI003312FABA